MSAYTLHPAPCGAFSGPWTVTGTPGAVFLEQPDEALNSQVPGCSCVISCCADGPCSVQAVQTVEGLEPGWYSLTAYARSTGGQKSCLLFGSGSGQSRCTTAIPRDRNLLLKEIRPDVPEDSLSWRLVTVRGIRAGADGRAAAGFSMETETGSRVSLAGFALHRERDQTRQHRFLTGGDVSMLSQIEDAGGLFCDEQGRPGDCLQILGDAGWDMVRLRLYCDPGPGRGDGTYFCPAGYQTEEDLLALARRARDKGLQIEYSFHFTDFWSNGVSQTVPSRWQPQLEGLDEAAAVSRLTDLVYEYTRDVMQRLADQGTPPAFVSFGNEMQGGILFPWGRTTRDGWPRLAGFLNAACRGAREVCPGVRTILHLDDAGNAAKYLDFFGNCEKYGVDWDIIGTSYYPFWTGLSVDQVLPFFTRMAERFDRDIMVMETGFCFDSLRPDGTPGQLWHSGPYREDCSPELQRDFLIELFNGLKCAGDGRVIGCLYWDPVMVDQRGTGWAWLESTGMPEASLVSNTTLFDFGHRLLPAADAFRFSTEGTDCTAYVTGRLVTPEGAGIGGTTAVLTLSGGPAESLHLHTDRYGTFRASLPTGSFTVVRAEAEGLQWTGEAEPLTAINGETSSLTLVFQGAAVTVSVTFEDGRGTAGCRITARTGGRTFTESTSDSGVCCFPALPAGICTLSAEMPGCTIADSPAVTPRLCPGMRCSVSFSAVPTSGSVTGTAEDETGRPLSGALVTASCGSRTFRSAAEDDGSFLVSALNSGDVWTLTCSLPGHETACMSASPSAGEVIRWNPVLRSTAGNIRAAVTDPGGTPVSGAAVTCGNRSAAAGADGLALLCGIPSGPAVLSVSGTDSLVGVSLTVPVQPRSTAEAAAVLPFRVPLVNPGFFPEEGGWNFSGTLSGGQPAVQYQYREGDFDGAHRDICFWQDIPYEAEASQEVFLPGAGRYLLKIHVYSDVSGLLEMFVRDADGQETASAPMEPSSQGWAPRFLEFTASPGPHVIGFRVKTAGGDWAALDWAELGFFGP